MQIIDEIIAAVGAQTDLAAKYEGSYKPDEEGNEGVLTELDDNDSIEITGEKIATVANFAKDKTINEIRESLAEKLPEILAGFHGSMEGYYRTLAALVIEGQIENEGKGVTVVTIPRSSIVESQYKKITAEQSPENGSLIVTIENRR